MKKAGACRVDIRFCHPDRSGGIARRLRGAGASLSPRRAAGCAEIRACAPRTARAPSTTPSASLRASAHRDDGHIWSTFVQRDGSNGSELQKEGEVYFHKAIEIAREQQAKSLELRALMSLSRLWQQQGTKEDARRMLAETYAWFTEGFDTIDLKEAKVLPDELAN